MSSSDSEKYDIPYLFILKTFVILGILLILFSLIVPEIRDSSRLYADDLYDDTQDKIKYGFRQTLSHVLKDKYYDIPKEHRQPYNMIDFYKNREKILQDHIVNMKQTFKLTYPMGTPMTDGYHALLPKNAKWKDGMIVFDKTIEEERNKLIKYGEEKLAERIQARKQMLENKNNDK